MRQETGFLVHEPNESEVLRRALGLRKHACHSYRDRPIVYGVDREYLSRRVKSSWLTTARSARTSMRWQRARLRATERYVMRPEL